MTIRHPFHEPNSRRRFLAGVGAVAVAATAGCTGTGGPGAEADADPTETPAGGTDAEGSDPGDGGADGSNAVGESCDDIRGAPTAFDPGDRAFPLLFEYPDSFEEYNAEINETESAIGAQFGHSASAKANSYPVNLTIHQHKGAIVDEAAATNWVTSFDLGELIDWSFDYEGEPVEVYENAAAGDDESAMWRFLLPAHETDGARGVIVLFQDLRSEGACLGALTEVAQALVESLRPNPDWPPE